MSDATTPVERAKRLILAILQESNGSYRGTVRLYKVFYEAHRWYLQHEDKYLTDHPIVHMTHGPGVHRGTQILSELQAAGLITIDTEPAGKFEESKFALTDKAGEIELTQAERGAIEAGLRWVGKKSATKISDESHRRSRAWREARSDGAELSLGFDVLTDDEYKRHRGVANHLAALFAK